MSAEFRAMLKAAEMMNEDDSAYSEVEAMAARFKCESKAPVRLELPTTLHGGLAELENLCTGRLGESQDQQVKAIRIARIAAVRAAANLELWLVRRVGAIKRLGLFAEAERLNARRAPAALTEDVDWSDADALAASPRLLASIDGNVAGMIFNHFGKFEGIEVLDVLHGWALSCLVEAAWGKDLGDSLSLMAEAAQSLNYAGYMDGWNDSEKVSLESKPAASFSDLARVGANARHASNRAMREQVLTWWHAEKHRFSSKDAAAIEGSARWPVEFSTIRSWLKGA